MLRVDPSYLRHGVSSNLFKAFMSGSNVTQADPESKGLEHVVPFLFDPLPKYPSRVEGASIRQGGRTIPCA
jgi:hypothetical protein